MKAVLRGTELRHCKRSVAILLDRSGDFISCKSAQVRVKLRSKNNESQNQWANNAILCQYIRLICSDFQFRELIPVLCLKLELFSQSNW